MSRTGFETIRVPTPVGDFHGALLDNRPVALSFNLGSMKREVLFHVPGAVFHAARNGASKDLGARLESYFGGDPAPLESPVKPLWGTLFQKAVWKELTRIPRGEVVTYSTIAARVGKPGAARAVGNAVGRNPLCVLIPCHRVVAVDGLGGFTGGLRLKRFLLNLEGVTFA